MSVFDKTSEYLFSVIKFSHYDSNSPEHQSAGIFQGQLVRYRHICNSMRDFKLAVTLLSLRMLSRGHPPRSTNKRMEQASTSISKGQKYQLFLAKTVVQTNAFLGSFK
jgi:hypothetical protein